MATASSGNFAWLKIDHWNGRVTSAADAADVFLPQQVTG